MLSYFLNIPKLLKQTNRRIMLLLKFLVCNSKKSIFFKEQEARELTSKLTRVKISILSDLPLIKAF